MYTMEVLPKEAQFPALALLLSVGEEYMVDECKIIIGFLKSIIDRTSGYFYKTTKKYIDGLQYCIDNDMKALFT